MQASGRRFDPDRLHHDTMTKRTRFRDWFGLSLSSLLFVIVRISPPVVSEPEADPESMRVLSIPGGDEASWSFLVSRCRIHADIGDESDQVPKGRSVDALALRGDEGRGTLR